MNTRWTRTNVGRIRLSIVLVGALGLMAFGNGGAIRTANAQPKPVPAQPAPKPAPKPAAAPTAKPATAPAAKPPAAKPATAKAPDAKKLFESGEAKFKAGDYAGALTDFQASDALKETPQNARYIGLCQDNLGHFQDAVAAYERFLANVPPKMTKEGDEINKRVVALKALPGKVHIDTTPQGATVTVDAQPPAMPMPADIELPPGKHKLSFAAAGREPQEKEIEVTYGSKQDVGVELAQKVEPPPPAPAPIVAEVPPPAPPPPPPPPPPEPRSKLPAYITAGIAVVGVGIGTGFGITALSQKSDFDKNPTTQKADDGENSALIADMAFAVAITFGVTSAVLFLTNEAPPAASASTAPKKQASQKITITPTPVVTSHGGGAGALVRF